MNRKAACLDESERKRGSEREFAPRNRDPRTNAASLGRKRPGLRRLPLSRRTPKREPTNAHLVARRPGLRGHRAQRVKRVNRESSVKSAGHAENEVTATRASNRCLRRSSPRAGSF